MKMKTNTKNTKIAVVGLGYVGLPLALLAERKGYKVVGLDINEEKINSLIKREPLADEEISKQLKASTIELTTDFKKTKDANIIIICVPTPVYDNHLPNLEPIENVCRSVGGGGLKRISLLFLSQL
ncbi:MAG: NAD(P)-binding domain-containing protein [bacterium]|nr:NAD(P)-binding domain-containing protein [bacterium]